MQLLWVAELEEVTIGVRVLHNLKKNKKTFYQRVLVCLKSSYFVLFPFGTRLPFMLYLTRCGEIGFLRLGFSMGS